MEKFCIPAVGAIIIKDIDGEKHILMQIRVKPNVPFENGLLEIPAGKIRALENIFDALNREVKEETGLDVVKILGENSTTIYEGNSYKVINFTPYACSQNLIGKYPIMIFVFICYAKGKLLPFSEESKDFNWIPISKIKDMLMKNPESFYPMHIDTLKKYINSQEIKK